MSIDELVKEIKKDRMIQKYLYPYTWLSGESTTVYPTTIWEESKQIEFQLNTDKRIFAKFIERVCNKYEEIEKGYYWHSDGSCPSTITFYYSL